ncbi:MAG: aminotransferase class I/II-fold pyridoxal phosphate-dependent enzyme [Candidatus Nanopelagicales bacterium]
MPATFDPSVSPFEAYSLDQLRTRTSIKWRMFEPDVLPLWVAEMDAVPVPSVVAALEAALESGDLGYAPVDESYAESFAAIAARRWGWAVDVSATTLAADVLTGVRESLLAVTEPGDAILLPTPVYHPLVDMPAAIGRRLVTCPLTDEGRLDLAAIEAGLGDPSVRALLLCSPHNPTGVVHTAAELSAIAALAAERDVAVVVDEIHAMLVPEGATFVPWLSVSPHGLVVTSASKAYNMAAIKAAIVVAGEGSRDALERMPEIMRWGASNIGVMAHRAAWDGGDAWIDAVNRAIASNAAYLSELLAEHLPAVRYRGQQATYLAWLDCRALDLGDDPSVAFREKGRVALNPGPEFGPGGEGFVRLNLATSRAVLAEAVRRMAATVS